MLSIIIVERLGYILRWASHNLRRMAGNVGTTNRIEVRRLEVVACVSPLHWSTQRWRPV